LWQASPNREALAENNADLLQDLAAASSRAAHMLESLADIERHQEDAPNQVESQQPATSAGGAQALDPVVWKVTVPQGEGGRPNLPAYTANARTSLASITSEAMLAQWVALNEPTYGPMPRAVKAAIDAAILDRRTSFGGATAAPPADARKPMDADERAAQARLGDIAACQTAAGLLELDRVTQAQTNRWQRDRPDLFAMVREAAKARMAVLKGAA
jgi:hypothetical protein